MKAIKNYEETLEKIAEVLMEYDKKIAQYQEDIYLYYDEKTGNATIDTFVNVGGNAKLNDNHYCIYEMTNEMQSVFEYYNNVKELAEILGLSDDELKVKVIKYLEDEDFDELSQEEIEDYDLDFYDYRDYIESVDEYMELLQSDWEAYIDSERKNYEEKAEEILEEAI